MTTNAIRLIRPEPNIDRAVLSRSRVVRGKPVWAWRRLSPASRKRVESETCWEVLNIEHLDRVLEARQLTTATAIRRRRGSMERICLNCDAAHDPFARLRNKDSVYPCRLCGKEICVTCEEDHAQVHIGNTDKEKA